MLRSSHIREIGHFQAIRHVASKTDVENGRTYALVLDNINDMTYQRSCLPCEGAARFQNDVQPGIALMQSAEDTDEQFNVVVTPCHEVTATQVEPFQLWEPTREMLFDVYQRALQHVGTALAVAMTVESFDVRGQYFRQLVGSDTKASSWCTRIVEQRAHLTIFRVNTQTQRASCSTLMETVVL